MRTHRRSGAVRTTQNLITLLFCKLDEGYDILGFNVCCCGWSEYYHISLYIIYIRSNLTHKRGRSGNSITILAPHVSANFTSQLRVGFFLNVLYCPIYCLLTPILTAASDCDKPALCSSSSMRACIARSSGMTTAAWRGIDEVGVEGRNILYRPGMTCQAFSIYG